MKVKYVLIAAIVSWLGLFSVMPGWVETDKTLEEALYLNPQASIEERVEDLLGRMTLEEKIGQMTQIEIRRIMGSSMWDRGPLNPYWLRKVIQDYHVGSILSGGGSAPVLNEPEEWAKMLNELQKFAEENTRLKIPILYGIDAVHGHNTVIGATIFPHNLGLAATWNPELAKEDGASTAEAVRATGIHWTFSPVLDVARDIRWGRVYETFGEDPYLVSQMGVAKMKGYQEENKIVACAKHYMGYSGSDYTGPEKGIDRTPATIPEQTLREVYLTPFKAAVEQGVATIMVNSSSVNGVPIHASYQFLTTILRDELDFKGFIVSDWEDIRKLYTVHKFASSYKEAIAQAINAGVDMSMVPMELEFCDLLLELVKEGKVSTERIDQAVRRILEVKFRLGLFEDRYVEPEEAERIIGNEESQALALKVALESMTLLENKGNLLPLNKNIKSILVTGPSADSKRNLCGGWTIDWQGAAEWDLPGGVSILEGIKNIVSPQTKIEYVRMGYVTSQNIEEAVEAAKKVDVAILALGEEPYAEGEGDVPDINLPERQEELLKAIYKTGTPIVVVLVSGRPLSIQWIADNVPAVLMAYLPGTEGGTAIAKVLFGDYNPGGKLPITFFKKAGQLPRWATDGPYDPLYPFGYGLSYTSFKYSNLKVAKRTKIDEDIEVSVDIRNTGKRAGDEVLELYINDIFSSSTTLMRKKLVGFKRITLEPGEMKTVNFTVSSGQLEGYEGSVEISIGGGKSLLKI